MDTWQAIDRAASREARRLLARACGSSRWVDRMLGRRPFGSREALLSAARSEWDALTEDDWREAFTHHPKIGEREALRGRFPSTHALSTREQAGVDGAPDDVLDALAEGNRRYEETFGYIFIVGASGRSADEMLAMLTARLGNDPAREIRIAAGEQAKITALRLGASA
jgi:2-oxo-4-hydroxy-4-carboxy-5-ureidoimidazoline decarboxylase